MLTRQSFFYAKISHYPQVTFLEVRLIKWLLEWLLGWLLWWLS